MSVEISPTEPASSASSSAWRRDRRFDREPSSQSAGELVEEDLLVEDVSIDGMCGVY